MSYKFGDIVTNDWAGETNPHKQGIVVRIKRVTGRLNPGTWVECTDGKGAFWELPANPEKLHVIGTVLRTNV